MMTGKNLDFSSNPVVTLGPREDKMNKINMLKDLLKVKKPKEEERPRT